MQTPTIETAGTLDGLLLITDHEGVAHRIPKASISDISNTSNIDVHRLEVSTNKDSLSLIFANATEVTAALVTIDGFY